MGELHLEIIVSRMLREFKLSVNVGRPQVVYRETIAQEVVVSSEFDREIAGQRQAAAVDLRLKPRERGSGNSFTSDLPDNRLPPEFVAAVEKGIGESFASGSHMGYPVIDVEAVLVGGTFTESVGSELAFTVCASMAFKEGFAKARPFLLEPIMKVNVMVPDSFIGDVIGDLNSRGGKIESINADSDIQEIEVTAPLSRMFGYSTSLRSATQGKGTFSMQFSHFDRNG